MKNELKKRCDFCKFARTSDDKNADLSGMYECGNPVVPTGYAEELCAQNEKKDCLFFASRMIHKCGNCGKEINAPAWDWKYWSLGICKNSPCCCSECVAELNKKEINDLSLFY